MTLWSAYVTVNIMRETFVKCCLLLQMLTTVKCINTIRKYCDITCPSTEMFIKLHYFDIWKKLFLLSLFNAMSTNRRRLNEFWDRDTAKMVPSGKSCVNFQNDLYLVKSQSAPAAFRIALVIAELIHPSWDSSTYSALTRMA